MTASCASMDENAATPAKSGGYVNPTDYGIKGSFDTSINIDGIQTIQIYCYCESVILKSESSGKNLSLKVFGTKSSQGYHGSQKIPEEISDETLNFKETRIGPTLKLESHEFTYIHHSFLIKQLEISVSPWVAIQLNKIGYHELDGRRID